METLHQLLAKQNKNFALFLSNKEQHSFKIEHDFLLALEKEEQKEDSDTLIFCLEYPKPGQEITRHSFHSNRFISNVSEATQVIAYIHNHKHVPIFNVRNRHDSRVHDKKGYIDIVNKLLTHIKAGDIYEINYCVDHPVSVTKFNPAEVFTKLNELCGAPFSVFAHINKLWILSASPERFAKRCGNTLTIQPMKGTARRKSNEKEDQAAMYELSRNEKERAENVMIVDLTRNDLSRICIPGTVNVDELCKVYTFKNVHQMISSVSGTLNENLRFEEIIPHIFPMGSMTGAPKVKAMELIQCYEAESRGVFSGSMGYLLPNGDFDFNVLIRSIIFNEESGLLHLKTGGAITINSDPEEEWNEAQLKAQTLIEALKFS